MADKTAAELEQDKAKVKQEQIEADRKAIKVESTNDVEEKKEEEKIEDEVEEKVEEKSEEKEEEKVEEKTAEQLEAEKLEAKSQAEKDRIQRRIDKEVGKRKAAEERVKELEAKLAAVPDKEKLLTEADVDKRAEEKAARKLMESEFIATCNKLADAAAKTDKDFKKKVDAMAEDIGEIPGQMIGVLGDIDNGGAVLSYLTNNVDEAEEIYKLANMPAKMALKLKDISTKIAKPVKQISKTPDPLEPVSGNRQMAAAPKDTDTMEDWVAKRERQVAERNERKRAGMRN